MRNGWYACSWLLALGLIGAVSIHVLVAPQAGIRGLETASAETSLSGSAAASYTFGVNGHPDVTNGPRAARSLGAGLVRVEWDIAEPTAAIESVIAAYARMGVQVQPLAGFVGRLPSYREVANLRAWALRFGPNGSFWRTPARRRLAVTHIEFGNETSYGYQYGDDVGSDSYAERARTYAERARDAALALRGTGVGLLVQADDGGSNDSTWVDQMFFSVPDLASYAAGWVVHPYGPSGAERITRMIDQLGAQGVSVPSLRIYVTEWGLASDDGKKLDDNYGYPSNMTYEQAATVLHSTVSDWRSRYGRRLAQVLIYQDRDSRHPREATRKEYFFGALRANGLDKGVYTAEVRRQLAVARNG